MTDLRRMLKILIFCACCLGGTQSARASVADCSLFGCVNGTCIALDTCDCDAGWEGNDCSIPICNGIPSTDPDVCSGKGSCEDSDEGPTCTCDTGWEGSDCSIPICAQP